MKHYIVYIGADVIARPSQAKCSMSAKCWSGGPGERRLFKRTLAGIVSLAKHACTRFKELFWAE